MAKSKRCAVLKLSRWRCIKRYHALQRSVHQRTSLRVLEYETRFSELFFDYLHCIQSLAGATGTPEPALRRFELALLGHLGYGVNFTHCAGSGEPVDDTMTYRYREEKGLSQASLSTIKRSPEGS
ncbi:DNA repair protein [Escherichia coli]|uniref:DNA repair protein n=1 Tax=Escherichia coli TaxID=562 RepID=A0A376U5R1_ECOLX|nr:DNA repair protein [Escherichia coli]